MKTRTSHCADVRGARPAGAASAHRPPSAAPAGSRRILIGVALSAAALLVAGPAAAATNAKVFPFLTYSRLTDVASQAPLAKEDFGRGADLFGLATYKEWRILGEVLVDSTEGDLERLQLGRWIGDNTLLWLGRYHTPSSYWDMVYHHSPYLQVSISRPQIMEFEDNGGVLPTHVWGIRADETIAKGSGEWQFHFGFGEAPELTSQGLLPVQALAPKGLHDRTAAIFMASYLPDSFSTNEIGVFASTMQLPGTGVGVERVRQTLGGAFANWTFAAGRLHLISSIFSVHSALKDAGAHGFLSGYAQAEYQVRPQWRLYVRYEGASGISRDPYLAMMPYGLAHSQEVGGVRFDVTGGQALTFEAAHVQYEGAHPNRFMVQWSAMFP